MNKIEQKRINVTCIAVYNAVISDPEYKPYGNKAHFRNCQATTYEFKTYTVLYSYNTLVAIYDSSDNSLYDVLRYVYGYTATSAQHIAKFSSDLFYRNIKRASDKNNVPPRPILYRYY